MGKAKSTIKYSVWNKMKQDMATDGLLAEGLNPIFHRLKIIKHTQICLWMF